MKRSVKQVFFIGCLLTIITNNCEAQLSARDVRGQAAVVPLTSEPEPKLVVDAPLADQLATGHVIIQYRTENLRIEPVFGTAALAVSPRIGHIHVTVDDNPWHWADASNEPVVIVGLKPGAHKILIQLADPTHKVLQSKTIYFNVPQTKEISSHKHENAG